MRKPDRACSRDLSYCRSHIVADIIISLTEDVSKFLAPGAVYLMSGIIDTREKDVLDALKGRLR